MNSRRSIEYRVIASAILLALSGISFAIFSIQPSVRIGFETSLLGIALGLAILILRSIILILDCYLPGTSESKTESAPTCWQERLSNLLTYAGCEEIFLRGFIFAPLLSIFSFSGGAVVTHLINIVFSLVCKIPIKGSGFHYRYIPEMILLALFYQIHRSLFACVVARLFFEAIWDQGGLRLKITKFKLSPKKAFVR